MTQDDAREVKIPIVSYADVDTHTSRGGPTPVRVPGGQDATLGFRDTLRRIVGIRTEISPLDLKKSMQRFLAGMKDVFEEIPTDIAGYKIGEMEIQVEISAEGEVSLLGSGAKVGGKGSLTLKLQRR